MSEPKTYPFIWIEPHCNECSLGRADEGPTWCRDNVYEPCEECGQQPIKYTLAPDQLRPEPRTEDEG